MKRLYASIDVNTFSKMPVQPVYKPGEISRYHESTYPTTHSSPRTVVDSNQRESSLTEPKGEMRKQTATLEQLKQWVWRVPCVVGFCAEGTINQVTSWIIMASFLVQIFSQVWSNSSSQIETLEGLSALNVFSKCSCLQPSLKLHI